MYTYQEYVDFCNKLGLDTEDPASYTEWCYYNAEIKED